MLKINKKIIALIASVGLVFSGILIMNTQQVFAAPGDIVTIPDANLKTAFNASLGQPAAADITEAQMATITNLNISSTIADFTGIEYATNLAYLYTSNVTATNLDPVTQLSNLTNLTIGGTTPTIPDLNGMTALTNLSLYIPISSDEFYKLNQLPNLAYLSFESNMKITSIADLVQLPELLTLRIQFCGVNDFTMIPDFPKLNNLAAAGQNTGRFDPLTPLYSTDLQYDATAQTLYLPFSMMPNRLTNFDGIEAPFTLSNSTSNTYFDFNGVQLPASRLTITVDGITVSGVTQSEFDGIDTFEYNARYNNPAGSYATPPNYVFYSISGGTYLHGFTVDHSLVITATPAITYEKNAVITETQFLNDVQAAVSDHVSPITSDFSSVVNFAVSGTYVVTLHSQNSQGLEAEPVQVTVTVEVDPIPPTTDNNSSDNNSTTNNSSENNSSGNNALPVTGQQILPVAFGGLVLIAVGTLLIRKRK